MEIGVPTEIKNQEFRVGLSPSSARALCDRGHRVFVQAGAGVGAGFPDADYEQAGAAIVPEAAAAWDREMVVKVKEPLPAEYDFLAPGKLLFTYLHLAANRDLTAALLESGVTAIAYETVELDGKLPLLMPMSAIAGRLAVQFGAHYLQRQQGGRGVLLSGVPGVQPGRVAILGGGVVGTEAAKMAVGLGAQVQIFDVNVDRLGELDNLFGSRVELLYSTAAELDRVLPAADLVVGAVLIPGKRPPQLVTRDRLERMHPGSVVVDVAVDQGGCVETMRVTSHEHPTFVEADVLHCGIPNMPGAVPWTATQALNNSTLPYVLQLAGSGLAALESNPALAKGLNLKQHRLVHPAVCETFPELAAAGA